MSTAALTAPLAADLEAGAAEEPRWASWARQAAERVRQSAAEAADQVQRGAAEGIERAKSVDWSEQVNALQTNVSSGLEVVKDRASIASERLSETVAHGVDRAKSVDWDEKYQDMQQGVNTGYDNLRSSASTATTVLQEKGSAGLEMTRESMSTIDLGESFTKATEGVSAAAGSATGAIASAGARTRDSLSVLVVSPVTWAQFIGVFFTGSLFVTTSFFYLPILLLAPQKFAMSFTIGSVMMMSSFVIFRGPSALWTSMTQREQLPFSVLYVIGLVGTLVATLVLRSYIATAFFAILQAVALLYFLASYLPGGKTCLSACFRFSGRSVRSIATNL